MVVRAAGIEPALCHQNWILSPARLPVPPRPHGAALAFALRRPRRERLYGSPSSITATTQRIKSSKTQRPACDTQLQRFTQKCMLRAAWHKGRR
jgi:hypothetical protein